MILTGALALSLTVGVTMYAVSRGHSPVRWGGASVLVSGTSILVAWVGVAFIGTSDWVFDTSGGALAMLVALAGPTFALLGDARPVTRKCPTVPTELSRPASASSSFGSGDLDDDRRPWVSSW